MTDPAVTAIVPGSEGAAMRRLLAFMERISPWDTIEVSDGGYGHQLIIGYEDDEAARSAKDRRRRRQLRGVRRRVAAPIDHPPSAQVGALLSQELEAVRSAPFPPGTQTAASSAFVRALQRAAEGHVLSQPTGSTSGPPPSTESTDVDS